MSNAAKLSNLVRVLPIKAAFIAVNTAVKPLKKPKMFVSSAKAVSRVELLKTVSRVELLKVVSGSHPSVILRTTLSDNRMGRTTKL